MTESDVQQQIQIEGPGVGCQLMRNNSGAFKDQSGRWIFFGLGNISRVGSTKMKSSDLVGFTRVLITPQMVGTVVAVITAVEVKDPKWKLVPSDKRAHAQANWLNWIKANGGFAGFAQSIADFRKIIGR